jgi:hypothetical protein
LLTYEKHQFGKLLFGKAQALSKSAETGYLMTLGQYRRDSCVIRFTFTIVGVSLPGKLEVPSQCPHS